ncbi:hypothetical protein DITRI_Ditri10aG0045400 [Diplodiscus trichospermus]
MNSPTVRCITECFVKPQYLSEESKQPFYLTPWELAMLSLHYIQSGLLFAKPPDEYCQGDLINNLLDGLKSSLSLALVHFYPLAGRLATRKEENPPSYFIFGDCNNSPGAKLIHTTVDMTISDVVSPNYVPLVVRSFFDHDGAVNHDGHTRPLVSIQVTELVDGAFIGCSMNHAIGDGTTFWHFFNLLSEIFEAQGGNIQISRPPDEFISKSEAEAPQVLLRYFHFSAESIAKLKARANYEINTAKISSFQSLSALVWRSIIKARSCPHDQIVFCRLAINNRSRLEPPLSPDYFGNAIQTVKAVATAGELLGQSLGSAAWQLHHAVVNHTDKKVRGFVDKWLCSPWIYQVSRAYDPYSVMMGCSPRFNKYGNEFGLGKALTLRSGYADNRNVDASP